MIYGKYKDWTDQILLFDVKRQKEKKKSPTKRYQQNKLLLEVAKSKSVWHKNLGGICPCFH